MAELQSSHGNNWTNNSFQVRNSLASGPWAPLFSVISVLNWYCSSVTTVVLLQQCYCCSVTAVILLQQCYCSSVTAVVLLLQCYCCSVTAVVLLLQCYCSNVTAVVLLLQWYCCSVTAVVLLQQCYCSSFTAVVLLMQCYCSSVTVSLSSRFARKDATSSTGDLYSILVNLFRHGTCRRRCYKTGIINRYSWHDSHQVV